MSARYAALGLLVLAVAGLCPPAEAHNPAETLFHPVPVEDRLLVVGGEGTYAYLDREGRLLDRGNLSGEGEVLGPPAAHDGHAAVLLRSFPELVPHVQGFDEEGPSWRIEVGQADAFGFLQAGEEGFAAFTTAGRHVSLSSEGEVRFEHELASPPVAGPEPAPQGGWWIPVSEGLVRVQGGEVQQRIETDTEPTDVTLEGDRLILSQAPGDDGLANVSLHEVSGHSLWTRSLQGLRLGGSPAVLEDRIVVGTYDPDGARVVALDVQDGQILWENTPAEATAAAPAALEGTLVVATTEGITSYAADGSHRWTRGASPYLDSPAVLGDLVVPSSSNNILLALQENGTEAWTWTDGVRMPSWAHHGGADDAEPDEDPQDPTPEAAPALPVTGLAGLLALAALLAGRRRTRQR